MTDFPAWLRRDRRSGSERSRAPIVTLTPSPSIDIGWEVENLSSTGKNRATTRQVTAGGGGINVARVVRLLGGSATAVHTAGGALGLWLRELLDEEDLVARAVEVGSQTRLAVVLTDTSTDERHHIVPESPHLSPEEIDSLIEAVAAEMGEGTCVVLSGSPPSGAEDDFSARLAASALGCGARLFLDTSGAGVQRSTSDGVYLLKSNRREATSITGVEVNDFDDARTANERLLDDGVAEVVVTTIGEFGSLCSTGDGHVEIHTPRLPRPAVTDAGAGDSLMAGLVFGISRGDDVVEACRLGVAAAAAAVITPETSPASREEIESLEQDVQASWR